ncbi:MAG: cation diffusion facilitator family transporter [Bacillota bacterium]
MGFTNWLVQKFIPQAEQVMDVGIRAKYGYLVAWVSIVGNLLLALTKVFFGIMLNSISLLADAVHTLSDVVTSFVVLWGFRLAAAPPDEKHPYGHGRIENVATLIIALLLIGVGIEFGKASAQRFLSNEVVEGSLLVAVLLVFGGLFKEWMARFAVSMGERINSSTLVADAWHHRSDAVASILVAVAMVAAMFGYYRADAVIGLVVSALIIYTGWDLARNTVSALIGEKPDEELVEKITATAGSVNGVKGVHKVEVHDYGPENLLVSLHIQVDATIAVLDSHQIAAEVKYCILDRCGALTTVHVEPFLAD